ncbi:hypothetical protein ACFVRD_42495 [Streptomyces sp. NPDC057908]|uniref:hypothetical protein n=1 Tax=Streptomyces sp. NPDC057908 TaxID=3346276 RepID=UPI0036F10D67
MASKPRTSPAGSTNDLRRLRERQSPPMTTTATPRTALERFPAGHPCGSRPADEYAAVQHAQGADAACT